MTTLVGDAELDEGSSHEAITAAGRFGTENLAAVAIDHQSASLGWPGGVGRPFASRAGSRAPPERVTTTPWLSTRAIPARRW